MTAILLNLIFESEFFMSKKPRLPVVKSATSVALKCADRSYTDSLIATYSTEAKSAVEKTIAMCKTVFDLHQGQKTGRLNKHDVKYFCDSVKLRKNSSQYRKFICIGQSSEMFHKYLDRIPQAVSVLYEITTIDSDKFIELVDKELIDQSTSLLKLKVLAGKSVVGSKNLIAQDAFKVEFDISSLSVETAKCLVDFYTKIKSQSDIKVTTPHFDTLQRFLQESDTDTNTIDVECDFADEPARV